MIYKEALAILEVDETMSSEEVRRAYRDLVDVWHPDRYVHNDRIKIKASEKLKQINRAYDLVQKHFKEKTHSSRQQSQSSKKQSQSSHQKRQSEKEDSFVYVKCNHCKTTNRLPKYKPSDPSIKCGKCGKNLYQSDFKQQKSESSFRNKIPCADTLCVGMIQSNGRCLKCGKTLEEGRQAEEASRKADRNKRKKVKKNAKKTQRSRVAVIVVSFALVWGLIVVWEVSNNSDNTSDLASKPDKPLQEYVNNIPSATKPTVEDLLEELGDINEKDRNIRATPYSGKIRYYTDRAITASLTILTYSGTNYLVKLEDAATGRYVADIFLVGGYPAKVDVPSGRYKIKWASGTDWYGYGELFGPSTVCNIIQETFNFNETPQGFQGYRLTLEPARQGNLNSVAIPISQF